MKKFDLSVYKGSMQYFALFDVFLKETIKNKEYYLLDNDIPPSSYRRCRISEQKTGVIIIEKLAKLNGLSLTINEQIDEIENFINRVYYNVVYKIDKTFNEDLEYLNNLIDKKTIIFPVLELFKIFLEISVNKDPQILINEFINDYTRIKKYKKFYTTELQEVLELLQIFFEASDKDNIYIKNFNNSIAYTTLAYQANNRKDYAASLYFATKGKEIAEKEGNIRRILYLNQTVMSSLLYVGNYEECYILASRQKLILDSINLDDGLISNANKFLMVACIGMEKYQEVLELLTNHKKMDLTKLTCLLIAYYNINKTEYNKLYHEGINLENSKDGYVKYLKTLNKVLKNPEKKVVKQMDFSLVMGSLKKILLRMC